MRLIAVAAILLMGCATRTAGTADPTNLGQAEQNIYRSEVRCIEEAATRADDQMSNVVMNLGSLTQWDIQAVLLNRHDAALRCQAVADRGQDALAARERGEYENAAALDRKIPLPVLTMTRPP